MKNSIKICCGLTALSFSLFYANLEAALPPLYESLSEYKSLLNSPELTSKLGSAEGIMDVKRTEKGFIITSNKYTLEADLVFDPQDQPGPAKFHFVFHELTPKQSN